MRLRLSSLSMALFCVLTLPVFTDETTGRSFVLWSGSATAGGCVTAQCHDTLGKAKHVHPPVAEGECASCHASTENPHPGPGSMRLSEPEPELCLGCHDNPATGLAYPHSAVEEGCTGCHSPHQGGNPKYVLQPGGKLCLGCHDDINQGEFVHGPVRAENCRICHGVHGGENPAMLNLPGKELCLACHTGIRDIMENAVSQHDPVANGVCWDCHTPHAANHRPFLQGDYPREFYEGFSEARYALCFTCHDQNAFLYERTSEATGFRNRDQNLHYFHVNRMEKGRVCKSCHGVHGADQEKLLASRSPDFGQWNIPLTWASEGERATCYVGCHRPKTYDRLKKIKNR